MRTIPKIFIKPIPTADRGFFPSWNCFCCQDRGYVLQREIRKFIDPDFSEEFCGVAQCARCEADKPAYALSLLGFDECEQIHQANLTDWKNTADNWQSFKADRQKAMEAIGAFTGGHYDDHQSERLENIEKAKQEFDF